MSFIKYKSSKFQFLLIFLVWVLILAIPVLFGDFEDDINWNHIFKIWKEYSIVFVIFLLNRYVLLPYLFFRDHRLIYIASILGIIILSSTSIYLMNRNSEPLRNEIIRPPHRPNVRPLPPNRPIPKRNEALPPNPILPKKNEHIPPFANLFIMSLLLIGFDTGLVFYMKWMQSEQNKVQIEKESIENKMAFLKNQISPHFFMNTLNNIHSLVDINHDEAKKGIIKLSTLMGYMLYESQTDEIPLQKEMDFVKSYVELMALRFPDEVDIVLDIPAIIPQAKIPPLLTISFIENAFKHGISYEAPSFVHISFETSESKLNCSIENSIHKKHENKSNSGIGLKNSINRLDLIFDDKYELEINPSIDNKYKVSLSIPI